MDKIEFFKGEYFFLSNFYMCEILNGGYWFPSTEHAFQAEKSLDIDIRFKFMSQKEMDNRWNYNPEHRQFNPSYAKKEGNILHIRGDWELIKDRVMYQLCLFKFTYYKDLKQKLLSTGSLELIEGNIWGDTYWGRVRGRGLNKLGNILMDIRSILGSPLYYRCNGCGFHNDSPNTIYKCNRCGDEICKQCRKDINEIMYCYTCHKIESGRSLIK